MKMLSAKKVATLLAALFFMSLVPVNVSRAQRTLPNPVLILTGLEPYETGGKQ